MNTIKHLLILVCVAGCFAACKKDKEVPFDELGQFKADTIAIRNFVTSQDNPFLKTEPTGIFYQILEPGTGAEINSLATITANYEGKLLDGTTFVSTDGTPESFLLTSSLTGWQIGLPLIKNGGKIRLIIPSFYGYRNIANERVPANSILDFTITVTNVE